MIQAPKTANALDGQSPAIRNQIAATEFRGFPDGYQFRSQLCKEFMRFLAPTAEIDVLVVEARPGIGATSICAEYLESLQDPAILLTVHAGSRAGYSIPYLLDQGLRQGKLLLGEDVDSPVHENPTVEWQKILLRLQRKARTSRRNLHLIVDGLYQIPPEDQKYVQDVAKEVLFLGAPGVRHIITWGEDSPTPPFLSRLSVRRAAVPPLGELEAAAYLRACEIDDAWIKEIISSTGCVPAKLASVVRLFRLGMGDRVGLNSSLDEYYELEWQALLSKDIVAPDDAEVVFAFLVFSKRPLIAAELAKYSGLSGVVLTSLLENNGFVSVSDQGQVAFSSNTHRNFFQTKLAHHRIRVLGIFVDVLMGDKDSPDTVQLLPTYYEDLGRDEEIVNTLTPQNLDIYLGATQSLSALRRRNELGLSAAKRINQEVDAYRFALQTSIVRDLESLSSNEARLAALAATGHLDDALDIAQGEPTKEGRLLLLAQYSKVLFDRSLQVDQVIANNIGTLLKEVDLSSNRERAMTIAENLVGPFPDLGIAVVEQASEGAKDYQDVAFTRLVLKNHARQDGGKRVATEKYASRISDSSLQGFLRASEALNSSKSAEDIKQSTRGLDGRQRSFFLRQWIRVHSKEQSALDIADYALDEVARDSSYLPTASDLRVICLPLSEAIDKEKARTVLSRVEVQRASLLDATPTVDRLRLDIEIARAKVALDLAKFDDELSELYLKSMYLSDDGVKLECLCWLYSKVGSFHGAAADGVDGFVKLLDEGIRQAIESCLATTAEHLDVFRGAVAALVESNPDLALSIAEKLNAEDRRDKAYRLFAEKLISRRSKVPIPMRLVMKALGLIESERTKSPAIVSCLALMAKRKPSVDVPPKGLMALGEGIDDPMGRAHALSWIGVVSHHYGIAVDLQDLAAQFKKAVNSIDQTFFAPELNYLFIERLAGVDKNLANQVLVDYQKEVGAKCPASPELGDAYLKLAQLTCTSFGGTLRHRLDTDEMLLTVFDIIHETPSLVSQVQLLSDLAMRAHSAHRKDVVDKLCEHQLMPLIRNAEGGSRFLHGRLIERAFSALHLWNQSVATALLMGLSRDAQDECRSSLIYYYITGVATSEPYDDKSFRSSKMSWATALTVVELIEKMSVDNLMVSAIEEFMLGATSKASISEVNASQRATLGGRLMQKIDRDLPDQRNVQHKGWQIVARAYCYKLMNEHNPEKWNALVEEAKGISNTSDSVYVLSLIAPHLPSKMSNERALVIREAEARLKQIPSRVDSVKRAISMSNASVSAELEEAIAKRLLTSAMKDSLLVADGEAASEVQRAIIDQAYQVDKEFAKDLVKLIDDDPARVRARSIAEASLKSHQTKEAVLDKRYGEIQDNIGEIGVAAWQMLGGLNSNRVPPQRLDEASKLLQTIARSGLEDSFGYYCWYLRNLQCKYEHSSIQSRANLVPLFEVTRLAALLTQRVGSRVCGGESGQGIASGVRAGSNFMVIPGQGDDALSYIKDWLDRTDDDVVLLCDPYFKVDNIEFIKELSFHKEGLSFVILNCTAEPDSSDLEAAYEQAWAQVAHVQPPPMRAVHVTYDGEKSSSPIHDRWLICGSHALRIGTSIGSMKGNKVSEISKVSEADVVSIRAALDQFVDMKERSLEGRRLRYRVVQW